MDNWLILVILIFVLIIIEIMIYYTANTKLRFVSLAACIGAFGYELYTGNLEGFTNFVPSWTVYEHGIRTALAEPRNADLPDELQDLYYYENSASDVKFRNKDAYPEETDFEGPRLGPPYAIDNSDIVTNTYTYSRGLYGYDPLYDEDAIMDTSTDFAGEYDNYGKVDAIKDELLPVLNDPMIKANREKIKNPELELGALLAAEKTHSHQFLNDDDGMAIRSAISAQKDRIALMGAAKTTREAYAKFYSRELDEAENEPWWGKDDNISEFVNS